MRPIEVLRDPRAFFLELKTANRGMQIPLILLVFVVFLMALNPVLLGVRTPDMLIADFLVNAIGCAILIGLVTLIAWRPLPIRAVEILGHGVTPLLIALAMFTPLTLAAPILGQAVFILGFLMSLYFVFVGLDVLVGREQALRVTVIAPLAAIGIVAGLYLLVKLI